ncbi:PAS domain S-box protein [bacterium]|nr:PAS domain S-box protein [bacterium]
MNLIKMPNPRKDLTALTISVIVFMVLMLICVIVRLPQKTCTVIGLGENLSCFVSALFIAILLLLWLVYRFWRVPVAKAPDCESILDSISPDVFIIVDPERNILMCNSSVKRMYGYEMDEVIGQKTEVLYFDRRISPSRPHEIYDALEKDGFHIGIATGRKKTGETFPLEIITGNLSGYSGAVLLLRDITERKQAEEKLKHTLDELARSNKELESFAYVASHDLQEPLRKITGFGKLLQESLEGKLDEDQAENLDYMLDGANRMHRMIESLLTYSRISTRGDEFTKVDLNAIIENLKKFELCTLLEETGGEIKLPEPLPDIMGDRAQLHQLLQNLIGNGLKFHKEGVTPKVIITARNELVNMVKVEVKDNGIGIDEKNHNDVFMMFKKLHPRGDYEGCGLGLAICKKIVMRHGGIIGVESNLGKGSTFWFMIPSAYDNNANKEKQNGKA